MFSFSVKSRLYDGLSNIRVLVIKGLSYFYIQKCEKFNKKRGVFSDNPSGANITKPSLCRVTFSFVRFLLFSNFPNLLWKNISLIWKHQLRIISVERKNLEYLLNTAPFIITWRFLHIEQNCKSISTNSRENTLSLFKKKLNKKKKEMISIKIYG